MLETSEGTGKMQFVSLHLLLKVNIGCSFGFHAMLDGVRVELMENRLIRAIFHCLFSTS